MITWSSITSFGDMTVTAPAGLAIAVWLLLSNEKRMALWWSGLFGAGLALVALTKIAFMGWGIGIPSLDFTGISGHAMRGMAVIPVLFFLFSQRFSMPVRLAAIMAGFGFGTLVAVSRVVLQQHSHSEAVIGWLLGGLVSVTFIHMSHALQRCVLNRSRVAFAVMLLLVTVSAEPAPTQRWLTKATQLISGHDATFSRSDDRSERRVRDHGAES